MMQFVVLPLLSLLLTLAPLTQASSYTYGTVAMNSSGGRTKQQTPSGNMWDPEKGIISGVERTPPRFSQSHENLTVTNQTTEKGYPAFLHCHVKNMAENKKVSWIRRRDYHILTSGIQTYSRDDRFTVIPENGDDWALQIKFVQEHDEGQYECQVSTKTGRYGYLVNLKVLVPEARIVGSPELHVESGSTISLRCEIEGSLTPPKYILWYHNNKLINYDQSRGDVTLQMDNTTSRIAIANASFRDSGNYTCSAANIIPSSVNVFVSEGMENGDKTAAIQLLGSAPGASLPNLPSILALHILLISVTHLLNSIST
ncbi:unnamed protein product [Meganyctiphanes norvegica]|uniref:Ig-like domain-containing protein n=1 Tax=Meganyctiphanes norvegica TaxID=48144 RepID=A0AAV2PPT8_MEGNR